MVLWPSFLNRVPVASVLKPDVTLCVVSFRCQHWCVSPTSVVDLLSDLLKSSLICPTPEIYVVYSTRKPATERYTKQPGLWWAHVHNRRRACLFSSWEALQWIPWIIQLQWSDSTFGFIRIEALPRNGKFSVYTLLSLITPGIWNDNGPRERMWLCWSMPHLPISPRQETRTRRENRTLEQQGFLGRLIR